MKDMPPPLLVLDNLGRRFGDRWIFRDLGWEVFAGEIAVLAGPNGSGKTTLLKVLSTLLSPSEGDARLSGKSLKDSPSGIRRLIGYVPSTDGGFFSRLTGWENLRLHASLRGMGRIEMDRRLGEMGTLRTLKRALDTPYFLSSAGMRQVLHIARAWLASPAVLFLDEPTRSLDPETRSEIAVVLRAVSARSAVLLSSHTESDWDGISTRTFRLGGEA